MNLPSFNIPENVPRVQLTADELQPAHLSSVNGSRRRSSSSLDSGGGGPTKDVSDIPAERGPDAEFVQKAGYEKANSGKEKPTVVEAGGGQGESNERNVKSGAGSWFSRFKDHRTGGIRGWVAEPSGGLKRFLGFVGPGYLIAVGYLDPGNWATDLKGGSQFGYTLLFIIFCSNLMAMLLQSLSVKLGVATGLDLASACRHTFGKWTNYVLYVLCELAIIACDLAEVIGGAIALKLLFKIPLPWGVAVTGCIALVILLLYKDNSMRASRILEFLVMLLVATVGVCFVLLLTYSKPRSVDVLRGYLPSSGIFTDSEQLYIAIGIIGATVMPHNLYLHSHLVKVRKNREEVKGLSQRYSNAECGLPHESPADTLRRITRNTVKLSIIDSCVALSFALYVNSAILIVSAANFFYTKTDETVNDDLFAAHELLTKYLGPAAGVLFAVALLIAGESSTMTATMAGQVVMEGFTGWSIRPWIRRLITRGIAIIPAMTIAVIQGEEGMNDMLIASQVALSIQLPFAVFPLIYFTASKHVMKIDASKHVPTRNIEDMGKSKQDIVTSARLSTSDSESNLDRDHTGAKGESHIVDFRNHTVTTVVAGIVGFIIAGLDVYLVITVIRDAIRGES